MSCINANIQILNATPVLSVNRIGDGIIVKTCLAIKKMAVKTFDSIVHPVLRCAIVCSVADLPYLNVSPDEVQWITSDYGVFYHVESDTDWVVVTNLI